MTSLDQSPSPAADRKAQRIIAAAREAFLEQGYDGVSMDEVAKRAGVAKQTVYAHYASKDALFLAVIDSVKGKVLSVITTPGPLAIRDRLQRIARELLEAGARPFDSVPPANRHGGFLSLSDAGALDLGNRREGRALGSCRCH